MECRLLGPLSGSFQTASLQWVGGRGPLRQLPFDLETQKVLDALIQLYVENLKLAVRNISLLKILNN